MKTLVIIPTYNELQNLPLITSRVRAAAPEVDILVVDDNSPDGTGEAADKLAAEDSKIHVLHRAGKGGLCGAYVAGFRWGLEQDFDVLCEMDADGSHAPEELHRLLEQIALGAGLKDMTAGYRAFRRQVLETVDLDELSNAGYIFQVDMAWRVVQEGFDVREVPITFTERAIGESKLDGSFVKDSLLEVTKWGIRHRKQQVTGLAREMRRLGAKGIQNWRKKHMI